MNEIRMEMDGRKVTADDGMTLLDAAQRAGIEIPTLCHHPKLEPLGGCRLCIVEILGRSGSQLVVSCVYPAREGLVVRTRSEKIDRIRRMIIEMLQAHAPDSPKLKELAAQYGADRNRFPKEASFCVHCGLCVRFCAEVKGKNAVGFVDRGTRREIRFVPEVAMVECSSCKECFPLCPTSYLQAAYVLMQSQALAPDERK